MEICPSAFRGIALRLVEWRAGRLRDPVARLQFLQGRAGTPPRTKPKTAFRHVPAPAITLGLALVGAVMLRPWSTSPAARAINPPRSSLHETLPPASASSLPRVWPVETTKQSDLYSNGLRVENQFAVATAPSPLFSQVGQNRLKRAPEEPREARTEQGESSSNVFWRV